MKKYIILSLSLFFINPCFGEDRLRYGGKPIIKEILDKDNIATTEVTFLVKARPEEVWKVLTDYDNYTKFMPSMEEFKVKTRTDKFSIVHVKLESPPLIDISYDLRRVYDKDNWTIKFKKIDGKIKDIEGGWKIEEYKGIYSKLTYTSRIDFGIPVPKFILDNLSRNGLHKLAENVRKRIESGGKWTK
jgi:ribosome-associated toxin RatA of RatAB toxin-antitoxin module